MAGGGKAPKKVNVKGKGKKKTVDPFSRKEWYDIKAPSVFQNRLCGKTLVTRTTGTKIASENLKGRVFEMNLGDLNNDEEHHFRKIKLCCEEVQRWNHSYLTLTFILHHQTMLQPELVYITNGHINLCIGASCLTNFHGMDMTRDKLCSLIRKWQTLIEAHVDVRTTDGYHLRVFCIGFTAKQVGQIKSTCYAKSSRVKSIRHKMVDIMTEECSKCDLKELLQKFILDIISTRILRQAQRYFPLQNVYIRKCKVLKKPRFDLTKLMEMHQEDAGAAVARPAEVEEPTVAPLPGTGGRL